MSLFYDPNDLDNRREAFIEALVRPLDRYGRCYHRCEINGLERIPEGAGLYVGNHSGGLLSIDTFLAFSRVVLQRGVEHAPYPLTHSVLMRLPGFNQVLAPLGCVEASRHNAFRLLDAGRKTLVYPGGDLETFRPFSERHQVKFGHRRGYLEIAVEEGIPIIPVAAAGAHATFLVIDDLRGLAERLNLHDWLRMEVWPIILSFPWGLTFGPSPPYIPFPAKIAIEFLEPIEFERSGYRAAMDADYIASCAERVEATIQKAVDRLVATKL